MSLLPLSFLLVVTSGFAGPGEDILQNIQEKFRTLTSLSVNFEVRYSNSVTGDVATEAGRLFLDGQGRFRTEMPSQTVVSDGQSIWMYDVAQRQVLIRESDAGAEGFITPRQLLYNYPELYLVKEVKKSEFNGYPCDLLIMEPRSETDPTRLLMVWVDHDQYLTRKFQIEDLADNLTVFEFEEFTLGEKLPAETFQFTPPEGIEIIDLR